MVRVEKPLIEKTLRVDTGESPPPDFCEHEKHGCFFCSQQIHIGHNAKGEDVVIHDRPTCDVFEHCDDVRQYALLSTLEYRRGNGRRDRN